MVVQYSLPLLLMTMRWCNCGLLLSLALIALSPTVAGVFVDVCAERAKKGIPPTKPSNSWGPYYPVNSTMKNKFFQKMLDGSKTHNLCGSPNLIILDQVSFNIDNPNVVLYTYHCKKKNIQHYVIASLSEESSSLLRFQVAFTLPFAENYEGEEKLSADEQADAKKKAKPIFDLIRADIKHTICPQPGFKTIGFYLLEKDQNELHYWKFPISCGKNARQMMVIEVLQDQQNCYFNKGKVMLFSHPNETSGNGEKQTVEKPPHASHSMPAASCPCVHLLRFSAAAFWVILIPFLVKT